MKRIRQLLLNVITNPIARNSAVMMAGSMTANVSAYLYHLVVGRVLGPDKYGELSALLSLFYILNVPAAVLQTVFTKYFAVYKARQELGKAKHLLLASTRLALLLGAGGTVLAVALSPLVADFLHIDEQWSFVLLYGNIVFSIIGTLYGGALQGFQLFFAWIAAQNLNMVLRLLLGYWWAHWSVTWTIAGGFLSTVIGVIAAVPALRFLFRVKDERVSLPRRELVAYAIPTFLATLGITSMFSLDVVLVKHYFPVAVAGVYASLSVLGKIVFFATSSIGQVLFPVVAERQELRQSHNRVVYTAVACIAGISFAVATVYMAFPSLVVHLLFGEAFVGAIPYLGWFGVFIAFFSISNTLVNICLAAGKLRVWIFSLGALVLQAIGIAVWHDALMSVIWVNTAVTAALCLCLLLYYRYAKA